MPTGATPPARPEQEAWAAGAAEEGAAACSPAAAMPMPGHADSHGLDAWDASGWRWDAAEAVAGCEAAAAGGGAVAAGAVAERSAVRVGGGMGRAGEGAADEAVAMGVCGPVAGKEVLREGEADEPALAMPEDRCFTTRCMLCGPSGESCCKNHGVQDKTVKVSSFTGLLAVAWPRSGRGAEDLPC